MQPDTSRLLSHFQASTRPAFVISRAGLWKTALASATQLRVRPRSLFIALAAQQAPEFEPRYASDSPPKYVGRGRIRQEYQGHKRKEPQPNGSGNADWTEGVRLSLFSPFGKLPPDGKLLTEEEETCDPYHSNCKTAMAVWESKCRPCSGTGSTVSSSGRRRTLHTCLMCHGIGYVRRSSASMTPEMGNGKNQTLGRGGAPPPLREKTAKADTRVAAQEASQTKQSAQAAARPAASRSQSSGMSASSSSSARPQPAH